MHEHTAAELIYERVDSEKPFVGMTNFKGHYITEDDVKIAKNYLSEKELQALDEVPMKKASHEYNLFRKKELANLKSDFDLFLEETKKLPN